MTEGEQQWELTKENIQPLRQGRAMASLQVALIPQSRDVIENRRREFESELRTYSGDDPLSIWHTYMLWIEQYYPAGGKRAHMYELLEKCIKQCYTSDKYKLDPRFLDIWLRYASIVQEPEEVFKAMLRGNMCTSLAKFYVEAAKYHESEGNTRAASALLDEGLQRGAQPASMLLTAKSQLEVRVGQAILQSMDEACVGAPTTFAGAAEKVKENTQQPGKWSKAKIPQKQAVTTAVASLRFEVHEEKNASVVAPMSSVVPSNVLSSHKVCDFSDWITPRTRFEPENPNTRVMYDKHKVYAGTTEFQFEEIRYFKMQAKQKEQERLEREAAKDREIEELRRKVEKLTEVLSKLQTGAKGNEKQIEALKQNITLVEETINHRQCAPALPSRSIHDSETPRHGKDSATSDISHVVRGLWDGTFSSSEMGSANRSADAVVAKKVAPFEVFADPTNVLSVSLLKNDAAKADEVIGRSPENVAYSAEPCVDKEGDENCAPEGYVLPPRLGRRLSGILQPSEDIPVAPPEEEEGDDQNDDDMAGVQPFQDDDNGTNFGYSSVFLKKVTSTPFPTEDAPDHLGEEFTVGPLAALNAVDIPEAKKVSDLGTRGMPFPNVTLNQPIRDLSVILECSKETSSKSGSSSSGSSASSISGHATSGWTSRHQTAPLSAVEEQLEESNRVTTERTSSEADENMQPAPSPLDPFDPRVQNEIMANLEVQPEEQPGFSYCDHNVPQLRTGSGIALGNQGRQYYVAELLAQGAYGKVYHAKLLPEGSILADDDTCPEGPATDVALKVVRGHPSLWEFYIMTELAERLSTSKSPSVALSVASVYAGAFYKNGSILAMPFCEYGSLLGLVNVHKKRGQCVPECVVLYLALEMLVVLAKIHSVGIIHGDVKPDNVLIMNLPDEESLGNLAHGTSCVYFTDFGRAIDMRRFSRGTAFDCVVETDAFQCVEMQEGRQWTYQTDWYGFLGCVHILLFGSYMETQKKPDGMWDIKQRLKRYWHTEVWSSLFCTLLNIPNCSEIPDVTPMIWSIHAILQDEKMMQDLVIRANKAKYWLIDNQ